MSKATPVPRPVLKILMEIDGRQRVTDGKVELLLAQARDHQLERDHWRRVERLLCEHLIRLTAGKAALLEAIGRCALTGMKIELPKVSDEEREFDANLLRALREIPIGAGMQS